MDKAGPRALTLAAVLTAAGSWVWIQWTQHAALRNQWAQDVAFFDQIFSSAVAGRAWTSSLLLEPTGFFEMVHFHPIFVVLVPLYALVPDPRTLLAFNACAVASTAIPLSVLAARISTRPWLGPAAAIAFLAWMPTHSAALNDFRPMVFWVPGLAWLALGVWTKRRAALVFGALLVCGAREESAYLLPAMGAILLVLPAGGWRRRQGLALIGIGLTWLGVLFACKGNFFFHFDPRSWIAGLGEAGPALDPELAASRTRFLAQSFLGSYLLAPLAPTGLLLSAGPVAWLFADAQREWHSMTGPYVHLRSAVLALWAVSGTVGAAVVVRRWPRLFPVVALGLLVGNLVSFRTERKAETHRLESLRLEAASSEVAAIRGVLAQVDPNARVATDYRLIAALSGRRTLWNVAHLYADDGRPPWWTVEWPLTLGRIETVVVGLDDPFLAHLNEDWAQTADGGGIGIWERTRPPSGGYPDPLP